MLSHKWLERRKKSQPSGDLNPRQHAVWTCIIIKIMRENLPHPSNASGSYGRQTGWQASRGNMGEFWIIKILYRLNYSTFILFNITAMILQCYNFNSLGLCQVKFVLRCVLKCKRFGCHFSCQSLLLGTKVLINKSQLLYKLTLSTTLQTIATLRN